VDLFDRERDEDSKTIIVYSNLIFFRSWNFWYNIAYAWFGIKVTEARI
jgi:hypothetical protein